MPQHKVAESLFAAGADDEFRVVVRRLVRASQVCREERLVDVVGAQLAGLDVVRDGPGHGGDFAASAIVERHVQVEVGVLAGAALRLGQACLHGRRQRLEFPDKPQPDAAVVDGRHLRPQRRGDQPHQKRHFGRRSAPVLGAEREHRQVGDTPLYTGVHHLSQRLDAALMSVGARAAVQLAPAPVAVHDEAYVARHRVEPERPHRAVGRVRGRGVERRRLQTVRRGQEGSLAGDGWVMGATAAVKGEQG
eukprot:ctg_2370.g563